MTESGYYPAGAQYDSSAPYNQTDMPEHKFNVTVCQTLSKNVTVATRDYHCEEDGEDVCYNTEDTDWNEAYKETHETVESLLAQFKEMLEEKIEECENFESYNKSRISRLKHLAEECSNWCVNEFEVVE